MSSAAPDSAASSPRVARLTSDWYKAAVRRLLIVCPLALAGCQAATFDGAFIGAQEVALEFPGLNRHATSDQDPRPLTIEVIEDLNAVLVEPVASMEAIVAAAEGSVVGRREGPWGIYGPFDAADVDSDLPLSFLIRVDDRFVRSHVELWVAPDQTTDESAFTRLAAVSRFEFDGELEVTLDLDLDVVAEFPELAPLASQRYELGGSVGVEVRDGGHREVEIDLSGLDLIRAAPVNRPFAGQQTLSWRALESGFSVALSARGPFDDHGFSGPQANVMQLRARVAESGAGRIEGTVTDGDVMFGPFTVVECWNPFLEPSYSFVDEPYQGLDPTLVEGDPADCVFEAQQLP